MPSSTLSISGRVITPEDADYDRARTVVPGGFDLRPAAIVRAADAGDVARVIAHAREIGAELAIRSGGHTFHASTDGGIVLDLSDMRAIEIDVTRREASVEPGLTAGAYTVAAGEHDLATGFGDTGSVGVGGITVAGGIGFLVRKHGLTIDDVLAAEVVTADGEVLQVDADRHPDLFWAIRGGGGNFGVVTRLDLRLHELPRILGGMLVLPATPEVIEGFVAETAAAPEELSAIANVMTAPPMPFLPAELHGRPIVMGLLAWAGDITEGERVVGRLRALAEPLADMVREMPYAGLYQGGPEEEYHPVAAARTGFADAIDRGAAEAILEALESSTAMMAAVQLRALGGAMARVPADATAFAHRDRALLVNVAAIMADGAERPVHEAWVDRLSGRLMGGAGGAYVGFLGDEPEERVRAAYPGATWDRLAAVKAQYDPDNVFRRNQNIQPAA